MNLYKITCLCSCKCAHTHTHTKDAHYATQTQSEALAKLVALAGVGRRLGRRDGGVWVTKAAFKKLLTTLSLVILGEKSQP